MGEELHLLLEQSVSKMRRNLAQDTLNFLQEKERSHEDIVKFTWVVARTALAPSVQSITSNIATYTFAKQDIFFWKSLTVISLTVAAIAVGHIMSIT